MNPQTTTHTEAPYFVGHSYERADDEIKWEVDLGSGSISPATTYGRTRDEAEANAALIVRAVNSHAQLVAALEAVTQAHDRGWTSLHAEFNGVFDHARRALSLAKGEA